MFKCEEFLIPAPTPSSQDLIKQEILLGQMRAAACLYRHQSNLRSILVQPVPADPTPSSTHALLLAAQGLSHEGVGSEEEGPVGEVGTQQTNLLQQLLMVATQPSPLKAMFSMEEMQVRVTLQLGCRSCLALCVSTYTDFSSFTSFFKKNKQKNSGCMH